MRLQTYEPSAQGAVSSLRGLHPDRPRNMLGAPIRGRILLVEDESRQRASTEALLIDAGFAVDAAASGEEAVRCFRRRCDTFVLYLLDHHLSGAMDGVTALRVIRALGGTAPAIVLTGRPQSIRVMRGATGTVLGLSALLSKPIAPDELALAIEEALLKANLGPALPSNNTHR